MFDLLIKERIADPARIHVVGGSNGGVMTMHLVCHLADRIAGAGVLVATLPRAVTTSWPRPQRAVPIVIMLGTEDPMKPWEGNRDQMSAEETVAYWRGINSCRKESVSLELPDLDPRDGCRVQVRRWEGTAPVAWYTLQGHGHGWPMQRGRDDTGTGPKTRDISAPDEFWQFFNGAPALSPK
jgi:polyhydroxybutyrate depolymerase